MNKNITDYAKDAAHEVLGVNLIGLDIDTHWDEITGRAYDYKYDEEYTSGYGTLAVTADYFTLEVAGAKVSGMFRKPLMVAGAEHVNGDEVSYQSEGSGWAFPTRVLYANALFRAVNKVCGIDMLVPDSVDEPRVYFPHTEGTAND